MFFLSAGTRDSEAGHGILEIAVVVMVAGIVAATSAVMFGNGKARYDLTRKAQNINLQIERARSLAVKYNQTLTLGFSSENSVFGFTCTNCPDAKSELPPIQIPRDIALSAYPTIKIKGNGTIQASSSNIVVSDGRGRQIPIAIANSGRTGVGDVVEPTTAH